VQLRFRHASARGALALALATAWHGAGRPAAAAEQVTAAYHGFTDSESNHIDSYMLQYFQGIGQHFGLSLHGALDRVHLPPLPGFPGSRENVDAITAASRPVRSTAESKLAYLKQRQEMTAAVVALPRDGWRGSGSYYVSRESDFLGQQIAAEIGRDLHGGSTSLMLRSAVGYDRISPDEHTGGDPTPRSRTSIDVTTTCVQSLTPKTQGSVGVEIGSVRGFQSNPYRKVYAGGQILPEQNPESRLRAAAFGQIDRYLTTRSSVSLAARYYGDDWGIHAGTFDLFFNQYIGDHLIVRYRYRRHMQTAASFYRELYGSTEGIDGYRTADYKLQDFDSNLFGIKVSVPFEGWVGRLDGLLVDLKYERYFDSHSFAANVLETGFSWPF
jgi:Protein of unknown function (DUF3570)